MFFVFESVVNYLCNVKVEWGKSLVFHIYFSSFENINRNTIICPSVSLVIFPNTWVGDAAETGQPVAGSRDTSGLVSILPALALDIGGGRTCFHTDCFVLARAALFLHGLLLKTDIGGLALYKEHSGR